MPTTVFFDPRYTQLSNIRNVVLSLGNSRLIPQVWDEVSFDVWVRRNEDGEYIYWVVLPGPLPYYLPGWLPAETVVRVEADVSLHCKAEEVKTLQGLQRGGSIRIEQARPLSRFAVSASMRGRSLAALYGLSRELHAGMDYNYGQQTRLWLNPKGPGLLAKALRRELEPAGKLGDRMQREEKAWREDDRERALSAESILLTVKDQQLHVHTLLFPQSSLLPPQHYVEFVAVLSLLPEWLVEKDVRAVTIAKDLHEPVSTFELDACAETAARGSSWMMGLNFDLESSPHLATTMVTGASRLERARYLAEKFW